MSSQNFAMSASATSMEKGEPISFKSSTSKKKWLLCGALALIVILIIAIIVLAVLYVKKDSDSDSKSDTKPDKNVATTPEPSTVRPTTQPGINCSRPTRPPPSKPTINTDGPYAKAAVAADDYRCSKIGKGILMKNGSAVDAAIATLFCVGVINIHSTGIGGGAVMVVYSKKNETAQYYNFREKAPGNATQDMFVKNKEASSLGALAIAVPGELKGMYEAWKKYGKLDWKLLVQPSIELAREGFTIHPALAKAINHKTVKAAISKYEGLRDILVNKDGCLKQVGDILVNRKLAITLERISSDAMSFYKGSLAKDIVADITSHGGIITENDLKNYNVEIEPAVKVSIDGHDLLTTGLPTSGVVLAFMLNVLKGYNFSPRDRANNEATARAYHKIIETFKYAYARRALLGDKNYANVSKIYSQLLNSSYAERIRMNISVNQTFPNASHYGGFYSNYDAPGTSHVSVLAPNGDAVSVTSTINTYFGSKIRSSVTGIIYNNEMDDFSTPGQKNFYGVDPSPTNFIKPGKRPMSSMSPVIFTNKTTGDVVFIAGASGGTRITTGTALVTMHKLWFGRNTSEAVNEPRFHHQLVPDLVAIEKPPHTLLSNIGAELRQYGHKIEQRSYFCVVQAISREMNGEIYAKSDPRKGGYPSGF